MCFLFVTAMYWCGTAVPRKVSLILVWMLWILCPSGLGWEQEMKNGELSWVFIQDIVWGREPEHSFQSLNPDYTIETLSSVFCLPPFPAALLFSYFSITFTYKERQELWTIRSMFWSVPSSVGLDFEHQAASGRIEDAGNIVILIWNDVGV